MWREWPGVLNLEMWKGRAALTCQRGALQVVVGGGEAGGANVVSEGDGGVEGDHCQVVVDGVRGVLRVHLVGGSQEPCPGS